LTRALNIQKFLQNFWNFQAISVMLYIKSLRALVVASLTGRIVLMDMDGMGYPVISAYSEHKHAVRALEFLPTFKYIVSAERDIRLWGTRSVVCV
jgi:hypothetical protein